MADERQDPPISTPEPAADGREQGPVARPFTEDVFDDEYYDRRGGAKRGGSAVGLVIGVVVGAAIAGSGAWYVFREPTSGGAGSAAPEIVKAETTPYKVKPENPGGMQVDNTDKLVYERVSKSDAPRPVENLLPPPEQPKAPPPAKPAAPAPDAKPPTADSDVQGIVADMIKSMEAQQAASKAALPAGSTPAEVVPSMAAASAVPAPSPAAASPPAPPAPQAQPVQAAPTVTAATPAPLPVAEAAKPVSEPPTATPPVQTAALPAGSFAVQLAAARSEPQAMSEWARVSGKHGQSLAGLTPSVVRADLGERGIFFRLRAGPLPDKAAADAICETLKAANEACIVVRP